MPIVKRRLTPALAVAILVACLSACGGGSDSEPAPVPAVAPEPATLAKADLISQGDGLCAEVNAAVGTILDSTTVSDSDKASQVSELYDGLADRLEKLGTPDDGPAPTEVITAIRQLADPETGDDGATALSDAASAYGFTDCAEGPAAPVQASPASGSDETASPDAGTTTETPSTAPAPDPGPSSGGVSPDSPDSPSSGGAAPPSGGTGESSGGSTGGIGPG